MVLQVCAELHDDGSVLSDEDRESWKENVSCTMTENNTSAMYV